MKSEKLKRFRVTQTLRFPSNIMKGFFFPALEGVRGIAVIAAALSVIWLFAAKFISETNFGLANVSFTEQGIIFRPGGADSVEYRLNWDDAVCCGRIKTRWAWWCYVSDHELSEKEKKEFPEFVEKGVFYFSDADNTVEELKKFLPPRFLEAL